MKSESWLSAKVSVFKNVMLEMDELRKDAILLL